MPRPQLRDDEWERIYAVLRTRPGIHVGREPATRRCVEAVVWMARAGCAWRLVPGEVGSWNSVYKRFARWQERGVWAALLDHLAADADLEWVMLDRTVVRAHACAAGAKKAQASQRSAARAAASPVSCALSPTALATHWPSA
jgi:transposase